MSPYLPLGTTDATLSDASQDLARILVDCLQSIGWKGALDLLSLLLLSYVLKGLIDIYLRRLDTRVNG